LHATHKPGDVLKYSPINSDTLEITMDHDEEGVLVRLQGRLGIDSSPDLRDRLLAILRGQPSKVLIVDLTEVSYIDTSGIATLLEALKIARNRHITLRLKGLQSRQARLFEATGLTALFETSGTQNATPTSRMS
jgi:anti-sigma B factor antagonist